MKRNLLITALCLLIANSAHALVVVLDGYGEIEENDIEYPVFTAEEDPLTGQMVMGVKGSVLNNGQLKVDIVREETGLKDEFCCAGQCTSGNGEVMQFLNYEQTGIMEWYAHYYPEPNSYAKISYTFTETTQEGFLYKMITVYYTYEIQGIEDVLPEEKGVKKILKDGILYIIKDNKIYNL